MMLWNSGASLFVGVPRTDHADQQLILANGARGRSSSTPDVHDTATGTLLMS
jgi:hypothetical protein